MNGYHQPQISDMNALVNRYFHDNVQLAQDEAKKYREIAFKNVDKIFEYINTHDPRFGKDPIRAGSYWQGLKVDKADEYDFSVKVEGLGNYHWGNSWQRDYGFNNMATNTDTLRQDLDVVKVGVPLPSPGRAYSYLPANTPRWWPCNDEMIRFGDLIPFLVKRQLKQLLTNAKRDLNLRGSVRQSRKTQGPALTMYFTVGDKEISVDFAPLVRCELPFPSWLGWPRNNVQWPSREKIDDIKRIGISVVAKRDFHWLYSFVECEKELVNGIDADGGKRKEVHRVMKKLNQDVWCNTSKPVISSYILKNIWFWEIERYPDVYNWDNDHLWIRLDNMTRTLLGCLKERKLQQYFYPDVNLMENKDTAELDKAADKVQTFLYDPCRYLAA